MYNCVVKNICEPKKNIYRHITGGLEQSLCLLAVQPVYKSQEENMELVVRCWLHLAHLLLTLANTHQVSTVQYSTVQYSTVHLLLTLANTHQVSLYDGPYTNNYVFLLLFL